MSSPSTIKWLSEDVVLAVHEAQIAEHGGKIGIRDYGLLLSALDRPRNAVAYTRENIPELAALYAIAIMKNRPFVDGNKRVGTVLLEVFLEDNAHFLGATDAELLAIITDVAACEISDDEFTKWLERRLSLI